jgi:predicted ArsR family transcriptional regulator
LDRRTARALGTGTRASIYQRLGEHGDPRTVADVADEFNLHPNVARAHLEKLAELGLVTVGQRKHPGGGRPAKLYEAIDPPAR